MFVCLFVCVRVCVLCLSTVWNTRVPVHGTELVSAPASASVPASAPVASVHIYIYTYIYKGFPMHFKRP